MRTFTLELRAFIFLAVPTLAAMELLRPGPGGADAFPYTAAAISFSTVNTENLEAIASY
jgi:hypothetical protein